jgi:hypothetical protein
LQTRIRFVPTKNANRRLAWRESSLIQSASYPRSASNIVWCEQRAGKNRAQPIIRRRRRARASVVEGLNNIGDLAQNFLSEGEMRQPFYIWAHWSTGSTSDERVEVGSGLIYLTRNVHLTMLSIRLAFESMFGCNSRLMVTCRPRVLRSFEMVRRWK